MHWTRIAIAALLLLLPLSFAHAGEDDPVENAKLIKKLREFARETLDTLEAEESILKLRSLGRLRDELDRRRDEALIAIFHPLDQPKLKPSVPTAQLLARIVAERLAAVEEIWNDPRVVEFAPLSGVPEKLRYLERLFQSLERLGDPAPRLREAAGVLPMYWFRTSTNVQQYYRTKAESLAQQYDGWVMAIYNEARAGDLAAEARADVRLTNAHRRMLGYTARIKAAKPITAGMDEAALIKTLAAARIEKRTPIRALRIDKRLVESARGHAQAMTDGGFFAHMTPRHVTSHAGRSPGDRMRAAGYEGKAMSENLGAGGKGAAQVHLMWIRARAQHQNLLGPWADIGVANIGTRWVQNFAIGDGGPMQTQSDLTPRRGS